MNLRDKIIAPYGTDYMSVRPDGFKSVRYIRHENLSNAIFADVRGEPPVFFDDTSVIDEAVDYSVIEGAECAGKEPPLPRRKK